MNILKTCGDILLCKFGNFYVVYQNDTEHFITRKRKWGEDAFNDLIKFSEVVSNK
jgi:hypothetical protein